MNTESMRTIVPKGRPFPQRTASQTRSIYARIVRSQLDKMRMGGIDLIENTKTEALGNPTGLRADLTVHDERFFKAFLTRGHLGAVDAFLAGWWSTTDLSRLLRVFGRNIDVTDQLESHRQRFFRWLMKSRHRRRENNRVGSTANIRAHYDIGNDLFQIFLDESMTYSSGIFTTPESSLEDASTEKLDRICRKLALRPEDRILEIGTGWGSFAIHAASRYGCHVTTTTISKEQFDYANRRVQDRGLEHRIEILLEDYRDLTGSFDKIASIEMIEAVGHKYLGTYFQHCSRLLKSDGLMALQSINMCDRRYSQYLDTVDFIQHYVFPGSCCASKLALQSAIATGSDFATLQIEEIGKHYAETMRHWNRRFQSRLDDVRKLNYSEEFIRLWSFYLAYCEAGFEEGIIGTTQWLLAKPGYQERRVWS